MNDIESARNAEPTVEPLIEIPEDCTDVGASFTEVFVLWCLSVSENPVVRGH